VGFLMPQAAVKKPRDVEADWDLKATQSAIEAAKAVIGDGINARAAISSLSDTEWGWIAAAAVFAWIKTKSQQAVEEGTSYDLPIRTMKHRDPAPWEAGAIETILPTLGQIELPWDKPVGEWGKPVITSFAWQIYRLASSAITARDEGATDKVVRRLSQVETERELSAANGGPLLARNELSDDIPF
jgi:hypothetical protein